MYVSNLHVNVGPILNKVIDDWLNDQTTEQLNDLTT